jgi:tetratricopeptide (TPR) repeat protein
LPGTVAGWRRDIRAIGSRVFAIVSMFSLRRIGLGALLPASLIFLNSPGFAWEILEPTTAGAYEKFLLESPERGYVFYALYRYHRAHGTLGQWEESLKMIALGHNDLATFAALLVRGMIIEQRNLAEAEQFYIQCCDAFPRDYRFRLALAESEASWRQPDAAQRNFQIALGCGMPADEQARALASLAYIFTWRGVVRAPPEFYTRVFDANPDASARLRLTPAMAEAFAQNAKLEDLIARWEKAADTDDAGAWRYRLYLAELFRQIGDFKASKEQLARVPPAHGQEPECLRLRIDFAGFFDEPAPIEWREQLAERAPSPRAFCELVNGYLAQLDREKALQFIRAHRADFIENAFVCESITREAFDKYLLGDLIALLEERVHAQPDDWEVRLVLAHYERIEGRFDRAKENLWRVFRQRTASQVLRSTLRRNMELTAPGASRGFQMQKVWGIGYYSLATWNGWISIEGTAPESVWSPDSIDAARLMALMYLAAMAVEMNETKQFMAGLQSALDAQHAGRAERMICCALIGAPRPLLDELQAYEREQPDPLLDGICADIRGKIDAHERFHGPLRDEIRRLSEKCARRLPGVPHQPAQAAPRSRSPASGEAAVRAALDWIRWEARAAPVESRLDLGFGRQPRRWNISTVAPTYEFSPPASAAEAVAAAVRAGNALMKTSEIYRMLAVRVAAVKNLPELDARFEIGENEPALADAAELVTIFLQSQKPETVDKAIVALRRFNYTHRLHDVRLWLVGMLAGKARFREALQVLDEIKSRGFSANFLDAHRIFLAKAIGDEDRTRQLIDRADLSWSGLGELAHVLPSGWQSWEKETVQTAVDASRIVRIRNFRESSAGLESALNSLKSDPDNLRRLARRVIENVPVTARGASAHRVAALQALRDHGDLDDHLAAVTGRYRRAPDDTEALLLMAEAASVNDPATAEPYLRRVIEIFPRDAFALETLGSIFKEQGRHEEAMQFYGRLLESEVMPSERYDRFFKYYKAQKQVGRFAEAVSKALADTSVRSRLDGNLGNLLNQLFRQVERAKQSNAAHRILASAVGNPARPCPILPSLKKMPIDFLIDRGETDEAVELICRALLPRAESAEVSLPMSSQTAFEADWLASNVRDGRFPAWDVAAKARDAGMLPALKTRIKPLLMESPLRPIELLAGSFVLIADHDPDALALIRRCIDDPPQRWPHPFVPLAQVLAREWPEEKELIFSALDTVAKYRPDQRRTASALPFQNDVARIALDLGDEERAQAGLRQAIASLRAASASQPDRNEVGETLDLVLRAGMKREALALVEFIKNPARWHPANGLRDRGELLCGCADLALAFGDSELAKSALEAFAEAARAAMAGGASVDRQEASMLAGAGSLMLQANLIEPAQELLRISREKLDRKIDDESRECLARSLELAQLCGGDTSRLLPALLIDGSADANGRVAVTWDLAMQFQSVPRRKDAYTLATSCLKPPALAGKFDLEILAVDRAGVDARLAAIDKADARGVWTGNVPPGTRGLRAVLRKAGDAAIAHESPLTTLDPPNLIANPSFEGLPGTFAATAKAGSIKGWRQPPGAPLLRKSGGPFERGSFAQFEPAGEDWSRIEIVGERIPVKQGDGFFQSGWLNRAARESEITLGRRYLDANGNELKTTFCDTSLAPHAWTLVQQHLETGLAGFGDDKIPPETAFIEPVVRVAARFPDVLKWAGLYLGKTSPAGNDGAVR